MQTDRIYNENNTHYTIYKVSFNFSSKVYIGMTSNFALRSQTHHIRYNRAFDDVLKDERNLLDVLTSDRAPKHTSGQGVGIDCYKDAFAFYNKTGEKPRVDRIVSIHEFITDKKELASLREAVFLGLNPQNYNTAAVALGPHPLDAIWPIDPVKSLLKPIKPKIVAKYAHQHYSGSTFFSTSRNTFTLDIKYKWFELIESGELFDVETHIKKLPIHTKFVMFRTRKWGIRRYILVELLGFSHADTSPEHSKLPPPTYTGGRSLVLHIGAVAEPVSYDIIVNF